MSLKITRSIEKSLGVALVQINHRPRLPPRGGRSHFQCCQATLLTMDEYTKFNLKIYQIYTKFICSWKFQAQLLSNECHHREATSTIYTANWCQYFRKHGMPLWEVCWQAGASWPLLHLIKNAGCFPRHSAINSILKWSLTRIGLPSALEPIRLMKDRRPDGLTLNPWYRGRCLVWDATVVDTFAESHYIG